MPGHDLTADRLAMRNLARISACDHGGAVEVKALSGERVAWLCPDCDAQLKPDHWIEIAERDLLGEEKAVRDQLGEDGDHG